MKPTIICIVGKSGSGKTMVAEHIEAKHGIFMIQSWTDRAKRTETENGHTFISKEEFDNLSQDDMIAYTEFGDNRYCCLKDDLKDINTYVIDDDGVKYLEEKHANDYNIISIYIDRSILEREKVIDKDRIDRDEKKFSKPLDAYDYVVTNNASTTDLYYKIDEIINTIK